MTQNRKGKTSNPGKLIDLKECCLHYKVVCELPLPLGGVLFRVQRI